MIIKCAHIFLLFLFTQNVKAQKLDTITIGNIFSCSHEFFKQSQKGSFDFTKIYKPYSQDTILTYISHCEYVKYSDKLGEYANFLIQYRDSLLYYYNGNNVFKINNKNKSIEQIILTNTTFAKYFHNSFEDKFIFLQFISPRRNKFQIEYSFSELDKISIDSSGDNYLISLFDTINVYSMNYSAYLSIDKASCRLNEYSEVIDEGFIQRENNYITNFSNISPILDTFNINNYLKYYNLIVTDPTDYKPILQKYKSGDSLPNFPQLSFYYKNQSVKIIFLDFFHMHCAPCWDALPMLKEIDSLYKNKGLKLIGVDPYDQMDSTFNKFLNSKNIQYPIHLDKDHEIIDALGLVGFPHFYLIDAKSNLILFSQAGYNKDLSEKLKDILNEFLKN